MRPFNGAKSHLPGTVSNPVVDNGCGVTEEVNGYIRESLHDFIGAFGGIGGHMVGINAEEIKIIMEARGV